MTTATGQNKPLYKAREMEELLDVWFYHPLGYRFALLGRQLRLTADQITYISMLLGMAGGLMLAWPALIWWGYALIIFSSVLDSADGQLARLTGTGTERGRILDGMIGYVTYLFAYLSLCVLYLKNPMRPHGAAYIFGLAVAAGVCTAVQSSMYDFYRTTFAAVVSRGRAALHDEDKNLPVFFRFCYSGYHVYQKFFAASHLALMKKLNGRFPSGALPDGVRGQYRAANRKTVRGWNILGDNTRFIALAAALWLGRPEHYFLFIICALSVVMSVMIHLQREADATLAQTLKD
ncbi:MAG: CDP-alcohol phosphatidyltransferase family protein [Elusimicrobiaceae bacterium]|nr:CDP-alcohol phosphatidyltransferase family protein [Elusimicrobiaceae bacterium]